jgi:hypothetical protein
MGIKFNPFSGSFDFTGAAGGGGGSSYLDGEVQNFSALPTANPPAVDSAYLVREAEGTWLINRKPAGIYIRTANTGTRASDWTYAGAFPDVFNDANFLLYDNADSTKNLAFQLSSITTGTTRTLTAPDASGTLPLLETANTFTQNQTLNGTNSTAPNQTASSDASLMTRLLGDLRYGAWENSQEITNFTGATAGVVSGGFTTFTPGSTQLRASTAGNYRSFRANILTQTTQDVATIAAGGWLSQAVTSLSADSRCFAAYYPVVGSTSTQWAGRAPGVFTPGMVTPYFLFRDGSWRAIKATFVRGGNVFPVRASNVITVETNGNHNLNTGDYVAIGGVAPQSMQTVWAEVTGTPTSTSFTYANTGSNETGTTILGDNMHIWKVEELGSIAASISSNAFTDPRTWYLFIQLSAAGGVTYIANGTTVATGTGFTTTQLVNAGLVAFYLESLATATTVTDFRIFKTRHTVAP